MTDTVSVPFATLSPGQALRRLSKYLLGDWKNQVLSDRKTDFPFRRGTVAFTGPGLSGLHVAAVIPPASHRSLFSPGPPAEVGPEGATVRGTEKSMYLLVAVHVPAHVPHTRGENTDDSETRSCEFLPVCKGVAFGSRGPDAWERGEG